MVNALFLIGFALFLLIATLVASGRFGDVFYIALKNGKATLFVMLCISVGVLAGLNIRYGNNITPVVSLPVVALPAIGNLYQTSEEKTLATIRNCQAFVTAQLDLGVGNRTLPEHADSSSSLLHLASDVLPSTSTNWDRCARAFGTNYWKEDISVKGENGGVALCKAYRAQKEYQSSEVNAWCDTVFADQSLQ